jgi:transposase
MTSSSVTSKRSVVSSKDRISRLEKELEFKDEALDIWHSKAMRYHDQLQKAELMLTKQAKQIQELGVRIEKLEAHNAWLQKQLFGSTSEKSQDLETNDSSTTITKSPTKRKRGKQPGTKGFSRFSRTHIPPTVNVCDLPLNQRRCRACDKAYKLTTMSKTSEEIEIVTKIVRFIHQRCQYRQACSCPGQPAILTAPPPPKVIPKGLFGKGFWSEILIEKFLLQRPIQRVLRNLELHGLPVSDGTIAGGLEYFRHHKFFEKLLEGIKDRNRCAPFWNMDETGWKVFEDIEGKSSHKWYLWGSFTKDTAVFLLDPSRDSDVPVDYFNGIQTGILVCDRYVGYQPLRDKFVLAYCWAHVRRDFIKVRDGYPEVAPKAQSWVERINDLFDTNRQRCKCALRSKSFSELNRKLRTQLKDMKEAFTAELCNPSLHPELAAALTSLKKIWDGLNVFAKHPEIPMDNNEAERRLRNPVVGRKNYYGSQTKDSGEFAATMFTILETINMNGLDVRKWLNDYLGACAENGGKPPDNAEDWLPWNMSPERRAYFAKQSSKRPK